MDPDRSPALERESFYCPAPACGVYALQIWASVYAGGGDYLDSYSVSRCSACDEVSLWRESTMIYPLNRQGEAPHNDMPAGVLVIYDEARSVAPISRKSAAGLLRLALQMLVDGLEPGSGSIDSKIGGLVQRGLDPQVQQAMDVLRVVGNESVHPGQIDLDADDELLPALFNLVNLIVEQLISRPKHVSGLFSKLPESKKNAIQRRDVGTSRSS